jgi:DNA-3-methyladenine glycosylase
VRTAPMFDQGGHIYVYFTYGMHYCLNIVVGQKGIGEAVLLRAGEPISGIEIMKKHRGITNLDNLSNGPAKLCQSLGIISTELSGKKLGQKTLKLKLGDEVVSEKNVIAAPRIGIQKAKEKKWRFYIKNNAFVSK